MSTNKGVTVIIVADKNTPLGKVAELCKVDLTAYKDVRRLNSFSKVFFDNFYITTNEDRYYIADTLLIVEIGVDDGVINLIQETYPQIRLQVFKHLRNPLDGTA